MLTNYANVKLAGAEEYALVANSVVLFLNDKKSSDYLELMTHELKKL